MSSAEQRKERGGCKKGGGGGSSQLRKSPVHSLQASQRKIHTKHTGGGGGEIQQQEKLSTLCNNLTYTRYKKKEKIIIIKKSTKITPAPPTKPCDLPTRYRSFCPPFLPAQDESKRRGCAGDNLAAFAPWCTKSLLQAALFPISPTENARPLTSAGPPTR